MKRQEAGKSPLHIDRFDLVIAADRREFLHVAI
jgi:hypothetical protein